MTLTFKRENGDYNTSDGLGFIRRQSVGQNAMLWYATYPGIGSGGLPNTRWFATLAKAKEAICTAAVA